MGNTHIRHQDVLLLLLEGLILRGGMKADDRPLWFDIYKAFPPIDEPKFARPKPEIKPIRQILYKEDALRAKFHSKGYGLGAVNMLAPGESPTKRLLNEYEKQKAQGVPEDELIDKTVEAVGAERRERIETARSSQTQTVNPESVTGQLLTQANITDIFSTK